MITVLLHNIAIHGMRNTQYFATGQIGIIFHQARFFIGGISNLVNGGTNNIIVSDNPVFRYINVGDQVRFIINGNTYDRVINSKYDDYTVRVNANVAIAAAGATGLVCIRTDVQALNSIFPRLLYSYKNDLVINYNSDVTGYPSIYSTPLQDTSLINPGISYNTMLPQLLLSPYHKLIDGNLHNYYYGYTNIAETFQNQTFSVIALLAGIDATTLTYYNFKRVVPTQPVAPSALHLHFNPYLYPNKNNTYINSLFRLSQISGTDLQDAIFEKNYKLDQFGNFFERGFGQNPIYTPTNIDINAGAGFLFTSSPQTIKFRLPIQADGYNNYVYIVLQRKVNNSDYSQFNPNNTYQQEWGTTFIFAYPTGTLVQLGLSDTLATGQCLSITPVGPEYEYTFQINVTRLADITNWHGVLCYVVIDTNISCESHILFEATYQAPPVPIDTLQLLSTTLHPYDTLHNIADIDYIMMTPTYFNWLQFDFDCVDIPNVKFKRVIIRLLDELTNTVELFRYDIDLTNHQTNLSGYPVMAINLPTQAGTSNHPDSYIVLSSYGISGLRLQVPIVQRIEEWLSLQPNNGAYFDITKPYNGQNYDYLNYADARLRITFEYEYNNASYNADFQSNRIRFAPINTTVPTSAPSITSSIIGIYDLSGSPVTELYVNDGYYIALNVPSGETVSLRAVFNGIDTVMTWGTFYPAASNYLPNNTYKKTFTTQIIENYYFTPTREGQLDIYVVFERQFAGKSSIITRRISIDVRKRVSPASLPNKVNAICCDIIEVTPDDIATFIIYNNSPIQLQYDGITVAVPPSAIVTQYAYDTIKGMQVITLSFSELYATYGYGGYQVIAGTYMSDLYCLVQDTTNKLTISIELNKKLNDLDFKTNPIKLYYRLAGYISSESVATESEEVKFTNGNVLEVKKSNEKNYNVVIKRCNYRIYNELASFGIFANYWQTRDTNTNNPLNLTIITLPPQSISPEWFYSTNYCRFDLDLKGNITTISNKC